MSLDALKIVTCQVEPQLVGVDGAIPVEVKNDGQPEDSMKWPANNCPRGLQYDPSQEPGCLSCFQFQVEYVE